MPASTDLAPDATSDAAEPTSQPTATAVDPPAVPTIEQIVSDWYIREIANSPLTMFVDATNHLNAKLPLLIAALKGKG